MLSQETLSQLQGLKSQMEAQKERTEAVIKGTQARYGFAPTAGNAQGLPG